MEHPFPRLWRPVLGLALASACSGSEGAPARTLQLRQFDPRVRDGVYLNEPLTFHFSAEVDPLSVGRESVVIQTSAGERARGSLSVEGRKLVFRPDVPHAQDLSDGGYRPASEYLVRLSGFPCPDGIRGLHGEPLARTETRSFTTVALDSPRSSRLFDDPHQEYCNPPDLYPPARGTYLIGVGDPLYLGCEKQIDPTSVRSGDFRLVRPRAGGDQRFELHARLLENEPPALRERPHGIHTLHAGETWRVERRAALIELAPIETLEPGAYDLRYDPPAPPAGEESWSLRDFSLNRLLPESHGFKRKVQVVVGSDFPSRGEPFVEDFVDRDLRAPMFVPDCDGTAAWTGTGRVEACYPLAAGDGLADAVSLSETETRTDLQATSIDLAAGQTCSLGDAPGLVVLRAQGRITLRGTLERRAPFAQPLDCNAERGVPLSSWLARVQASNPSWTVLIAGGDILIEGEIRSDVPVLLIAGGQVRTLVESRLAQGLWWTQSGAAVARVPGEKGEARFALDPPVGRNPLRAALRYAVVSGAVPATGPVERWTSAGVSGGYEPAKISTRPGKVSSGFSVRYFPADATQAPDFGKGPTSPAFLPQPGPVRFVVELVLGDQEDWQAPYVDRVQLEFEQPR